MRAKENPLNGCTRRVIFAVCGPPIFTRLLRAVAECQKAFFARVQLRTSPAKPLRRRLASVYFPSYPAETVKQEGYELARIHHRIPADAGCDLLRFSPPKMTCDHCQKEIVHSNSGDEFLALTPLPRRASRSGCTVTDVLLTPELTGPKNFCGIRCVCQWAVKQISPYTGKPYAEALPQPEAVISVSFC